MTTNARQDLRVHALPEPLKHVAVAGCHDGTLKEALEDYYDAEQMRAYAIAALTAAQGDAIAWRIRIGASDMWGYCESESDADFIGHQSGLRYVKQPLYARASSTPPLPAQPAPVTDALPGADVVIRERDCTDEAARKFYAKGWNECLAALSPAAQDVQL